METDIKDQEREDIEAMLASPGWAHFVEHVKSEWGSQAYRRKARTLLNGDMNAVSNATSLFLQLEYATDQIEDIMRWPATRAEKLRRGSSVAAATR